MTNFNYCFIFILAINFRFSSTFSSLILSVLFKTISLQIENFIVMSNFGLISNFSFISNFTSNIDNQPLNLRNIIIHVNFGIMSLSFCDFYGH